jgi:PhoD related phosphatase
MVKLGPILKFLGCQNDTWGVSALVVTDAADAAPEVAIVGQRKPAAVLLAQLQHTGSAVWRFDFAIAQTALRQTVAYTCNGVSADLQVPAKGAQPALAYASCNGFSDPKLMKQVKDKNALWARMARLHDAVDTIRGRKFGPWDVLLMGGDQVYSDSMWVDVPALAQWSELTYDQRMQHDFSPALRTDVETFFENLYLARWAQVELRVAMRSIPSVMMWDDHDIMDGWGSYPFEQHNCAVYQGIFSVAKRYFMLFQQQTADLLPPATLPGQSGFSKGFRIGGMGLLALDMRSERAPHDPRASAIAMVNHSGASGIGSIGQADQPGNYQPDQVMSEASWRAVYQWLDAQESMSHLLIMSSIPVVHPTFGLLEKMLGALPGQQELEDDLRDHWTSPPHLQERLRLVHRLLRLSAQKTCRVTLLSGDVHVAAVGAVESDRNDVPPNARVINQLTSSGIVHPAPPAIARYFLEQACKQVETLDRGITATMYEFPATTRRLIGARNFLTIEPDHNVPDGEVRLWANWWVEGEADPTTKVIHPVQSQQHAVEPRSGTGEVLPSGRTPAADTR